MKINTRSALVATGLALAVGAGFLAGEAWARQPHMQAALDALQTARSELQDATSNKGGHRLKAIDYVDDAIHEVRRGMEFAD